MSAKSKIYEWGKCAHCDAPMKLKPKDRRFCKPRCRYQYNNLLRPHGKLQIAVACVNENLITLADAVALGIGNRSTLRAKIRRNELPAVRLFGRVLLNKQDVLRLSEKARV